MITEDYVSYEIAKLLKEKGFDSDDVGCHGGFYSERCYESGHGIKTQSGQEVGIVYDDLTNSELDYDEYLRPTLQMAIKWLREVHNIDISITPDRKENYTTIIFVNKELPFTSIGSFKTHKAACEAAIKYVLENLI